MKKIKVYAIVALLLFNFAIVVYAKVNFTHIGQIPATIIQISPPNYAMNPSGTQLSVLNNLNELMDKATQVSLIKVSSDKTYYPGASQCTLTVLKTFKGNQDLETINMIENLDIQREAGEMTMYSTEGYVPLLKDEEYIVFLNKTGNDYFENSFMYADKIFTKFLANHQATKIIENEINNPLPFMEIEGVDYVNVLWDEEQLSEFKKVDEVYRMIKTEFNETYEY